MSTSDKYDGYVRTIALRLLTEAEWEYATRAYEMYHWAVLDDSSEVFTEKSLLTLLDCANPMRGGPLDMSGNTTALCWDSYEEECIESKGIEKSVLSRGGCWGSRVVPSPVRCLAEIQQERSYLYQEQIRRDPYGSKRLNR